VVYQTLDKAKGNIVSFENWFVFQTNSNIKPILKRG
jgi:hypothetical protein